MSMSGGSTSGATDAMGAPMAPMGGGMPGASPMGGGMDMASMMAAMGGMGG